MQESIEHHSFDIDGSLQGKRPIQRDLERRPTKANLCVFSRENTIWVIPFVLYITLVFFHKWKHETRKHNMRQEKTTWITTLRRENTTWVITLRIKGVFLHNWTHNKTQQLCYQSWNHNRNHNSHSWNHNLNHNFRFEGVFFHTRKHNKRKHQMNRTSQSWKHNLNHNSTQRSSCVFCRENTIWIITLRRENTTWISTLRIEGVFLHNWTHKTTQ